VTRQNDQGSKEDVDNVMGGTDVAQIQGAAKEQKGTHEEEEAR